MWLRLVMLGWLFNGLAQLCQKTVHETGGDKDMLMFLLCLYIFGFISAALFMSMKRSKIGKKEVGYGILAGTVNILGVGSVQLSLMKLSSSVVFPVTIGGTIIGTCIAGAIFFGEKLDRKKIVGLVLGVVAIVLLSV